MGRGGFWAVACLLPQDFDGEVGDGGLRVGGLGASGCHTLPHCGRTMMVMVMSFYFILFFFFFLHSYVWHFSVGRSIGERMRGRGMDIRCADRTHTLHKRGDSEGPLHTCTCSFVFMIPERGTIHLHIQKIFLGFSLLLLLSVFVSTHNHRLGPRDAHGI